MPSQVAPAFMTFVAENVRSRRLKAGMNQKELASASGVSLRMLGAIEAGATSASTATLDRIGMALDATLADLVTDPSAPRSVTVERLGWRGERGGEGVLRWSLAARKEVDAWAWRLEPGERYQAAADPQGWHVMLFVLEGRLTLELGGEIIGIERDAFLFDSTRPHAFRNDGTNAVHFYRCTTW